MVFILIGSAGGDIVIPIEVYANKLAATEHHAALVEHSRLHPGDATAFEAAQFESDQEQMLTDLKNSEPPTTERPSYFKVYDDIYGQLQGIGYDRQTAEQYATIAAVRAKQRAAVLGKDAFELYNESPLKIVRPLPEGVQRQSVDMGLDPLLDRLRAGDIPTDESIFGQSLLQFVRDRGVKDDRGDLKSMDVDAARQPGKKNIIRKDGQGLDRVREGAVEAGYLPEGATIADLLDKIDQELRGTPVYSQQVQNPQGQETRLALDELKQHLDQVGLDYNQLSNEQIRRELYQMQGGELWQSQPVAELTGQELGDFGDDTDALRIAAIQWYRDNLQGKTPAHSNDIGDIVFTGKGRKEVAHFSADPDKLKLLPALREIIEQGEYIKEEQPNHPRKDGIVKFHLIEADVKMGGKLFRVLVEVGEDKSGNKFYDLFPDAVEHAKKKTSKQRSESTSPGEPGGISEGISEGIATLNINTTPVDKNVKTLLQSAGVKRGFFRTSPDMTAREIGILKDADLSTFVHEISHSWLEELKLDASRSDAPEQLKNDWATISKWLGTTDGELSREMHEQFARGGETYLMEGKSPSTELQPIFQRFKSWLTSIYKTLSGLNVKMNDDVRGVFDRLLASESEIKQARQAQNMVELFATKEDAGMTDAEFAAYRKQAAQAHTEEVEKLERS